MVRTMKNRDSRSSLLNDSRTKTPFLLTLSMQLLLVIQVHVSASVIKILQKLVNSKLLYASELRGNRRGHSQDGRDAQRDAHVDKLRFSLRPDCLRNNLLGPGVGVVRDLYCSLALEECRLEHQLVAILPHDLGFRKPSEAMSHQSLRQAIDILLTSPGLVRTDGKPVRRAAPKLSHSPLQLRVHGALHLLRSRVFGQELRVDLPVGEGQESARGDEPNKLPAAQERFEMLPDLQCLQCGNGNISCKTASKRL
mmetsp:Transcript_56362/g.123494  ORF Transcript_56362/g.123494 Transcript_56362/m.123494 type:complete len:253 (-) Transcript_56362:353-1111(-)